MTFIEDAHERISPRFYSSKIRGTCTVDVRKEIEKVPL